MKKPISLDKFLKAGQPLSFATYEFDIKVFGGRTTILTRKPKRKKYKSHAKKAKRA